MRFLALLIPLAALTPRAAHAGNPWEELMGAEKPHLWNEPEGRFSIGVPIGWRAEVRKGHPQTVDLWATNSDRHVSAHITVESRTLPPKVVLAHFAIRVLEETRASAQQVRVIEEDRATVSGVPAIRRYLTHQERGHSELTDELVQVMLITGERAFVISLGTVYGGKNLFWEDFEKMVSSFSARAPGEETPGLGDDATPAGKRKRVRAGEMVNPDALKY